MSDLTLNRFLAYGTAAERAAFTPDPPTPASGPDQGYVWYETDTGALYAWDGSAWDAIEGSGGDVTAASTITDHALVRGDGGAKGVQSSPITMGDTGVLAFPAGVRQTFVPDATSAGVNVGAVAGDPSAPSNGDLWYDSVADELTARIDGANVALGAGGGGASDSFATIAVSGQSDVVADSATDTLTLAAGSGITITTDAGTDTITVAAATRATTIGMTFINPTTGIKGDMQVPFACTITAARLFADQTGSIVVDIWKDTYANFPPTNDDSITASAPPTLSSAVKSEDTTLTGWTTSISAGDILRFNIDSVATVERVTLQLTVTI